jgi:hypothetical protein
LRLRNTTPSQTAAIPSPVLHAFSSERQGPLGIPFSTPFLEESTYWNPSWTLARGAVQTTNIADMTRTAIGIGSGKPLFKRSYARIADRVAERRIGRHAHRVERLHVELHEADTLLVADRQPAMNRDQTREPELAREAVRAAERLRVERLRTGGPLAHPAPAGPVLDVRKHRPAAGEPVRDARAGPGERDDVRRRVRPAAVEAGRTRCGRPGTPRWRSRPAAAPRAPAVP